MRIKDLGLDDRPREKMLSQGARYLSNAELLAIVIGSGISGGLNATELARELLLAAEGRLGVLAVMPIERLMKQKGIGQARAIAIAAALELGTRAQEERAVMQKGPLRSPELVYSLMKTTMRNLDHEECWVLFLNSKCILLGKELAGSGSFERTVIDTRKILRRAIEKQAGRIILVHNHPGGDPTPSQADIRQTETLKRALSSVDISLIDHVIVCERSYFSFSEDRAFSE